jgi:hypothetical protein
MAMVRHTVKQMTATALRKELQGYIATMPEQNLPKNERHRRGDMNFQDIAKKYPEAAAFAGVAVSVWNGNNSPAKVEMTVTGKLYAELKRLLDKDIQTVFLTDSDIRHIKKKHGSKEAARGQIDITPDDFALIPLVLNEFDKAEHDLTDKRGNKRLFFQKNCGNMVYIATVERGDNKVEVRTFWKMHIPGASC